MFKKEKSAAKSAPKENKGKVFKFTLDEYQEWKGSGTNTGIVKDFPEWLEEQL